MEEYISKAALVAEIEKLISNGKLKRQQSQENNDQVSYIAWSEHIATCGKILLFLDTLEVKEAKKESMSDDLKEAINQSFLYHESHGDDFRSDKQIETAYKYGFESGAKWADEHSSEVKEVDAENSFEGNVCKNCNTYLKEMDKDAIAKTLEPQERGGDEIIYTSSCEWCNRDSCEDCYDEED